MGTLAPSTNAKRREIVPRSVFGLFYKHPKVFTSRSEMVEVVEVLDWEEEALARLKDFCFDPPVQTMLGWQCGEYTHFGHFISLMSSFDRHPIVKYVVQKYEEHMNE